MPREFTPATTLDNLKREARRWLKALRNNASDAGERLRRVWADAPLAPTLRDVQHALAREHGFPGWAALKGRLARDVGVLQPYQRAAEALVTAYGTGEVGAMRIVWDYFGHMRQWHAMRRYVRLDLGKTESPTDGEVDEITLAEARYLVARAQRFESWDELLAYAHHVDRAAARPVAKAVTMIANDDVDAPQVVAASRDWNEAIAMVRDHGLKGLHADGQMTDQILERLSHVEQLSVLELDGSRELTDDGLRHLERLQGLRRLNLAGCSVTDRGLAVLRRLPALESVVLSWTPVTDVGAAHLEACAQLRSVDLTGTRTGDGAIRALRGKAALHDLRTGVLVTDAGLGALRDIPTYARWQGGEREMELLRPDARPNMLSLRGTFGDAGLAQLAELEGVFALELDSDRLSVSGKGLAPLTALPHLEWLGFEATDDSMPFVAALPHLRFLMCQDTVAGDDGFVALSRSRSIEYIWGRRCHNLQRRGFMALADMPAPRYLSVSCKHVDDVGVSALSSFPALVELMPMDVPDEGYRHIGRCQRLESLVLMYCRDTGDRATEHITGLPRLRKYFASYNRITDRTPQMLSEISSLEEITFDSCAGLTTAGIVALARLPRLRKVRAESMPHVTREVLDAFGPGVEVRYST